MFRRFLHSALILLSLGVVVSSAADFWQKKKFSEWIPKEVQEMLNNSPWAMRVEVAVSQSRPDGGGANAGGGRASARPPNPYQVSPGHGSGTGPDVGGPPPTTPLLVRFHAALPIKQAVAVARFGDGVLKSPEAATMLSRKEDAYVIGITGPQRLLIADPAELKESARLVIKGRDPIAAENVTADNGAAGAAVYFFFPRGTNPIKLEDNSFELQVKFPSFQLKYRFKLKEMIFEGNLEI